MPWNSCKVLTIGIRSLGPREVLAGHVLRSHQPVGSIVSRKAPMRVFVPIGWVEPEKGLADHGVELLQAFETLQCPIDWASSEARIMDSLLDCRILPA